MKGIMFCEPLFHAVVEGRKTQTRRVMRPQCLAGPEVSPIQIHELDGGKVGFFDEDRDYIPKYQPGEILYLKEPWCLEYDDGKQTGRYLYRYDGQEVRHYDGGYNKDGSERSPWQSKICMPEAAARHYIRVVSVRAELLQAITVADIAAEGVTVYPSGTANVTLPNGDTAYSMPIPCFATLWDALAKPGYRWHDNPWVWRYEFMLTVRPK